MAKLDEALDLLREARRYVRTDPAEAERLAEVASSKILAAMLPGSLDFRLRRNLGVGMRFVLAAPDVLKGYIDGAILEIEDYRAKEAANGSRD